MLAARRSGIFQNIRVITNGLLLTKMNAEFWNLADIVRISVYPSTTDFLPETKIEFFRAVASRHQTKLEVVRDTTFMKAIRNTRIEDAKAVQQIFSTCGEAHGWSCNLLYQNRIYRCSRVHTLDRYLNGIGVEHENFTVRDGILIDGRASLFTELKYYLRSSDPLKACSFCLGTSGPLIQHSQLTVPEVRPINKPLSDSGSGTSSHIGLKS